MSNSLHSVITIGNFDGFHLGHRSLMSYLEGRSQFYRVPGYVITFKPHPVEVLYPERKFERIFSDKDQEEQIRLFPSLSLKFLQFNREFSRQSPLEFLDYLRNHFQPKALVVGHDFMFGHKKAGDHDLLAQYCIQHQIELKIMPAVKIGQQVISSSKIRDELKLGEIKFANQMLGRPFYIVGEVTHGKKLGRSIGIPTANLKIQSTLYPRLGVYFSKCYLSDSRAYFSVTNIGVNPTVSDELAVKVESHIFDFSRDIYGEILRVELLGFLRTEKKFANIDDLKTQIGLDMAQARKQIEEHVQCAQ